MDLKKIKKASLIVTYSIIGFIISYYLSCSYFSADADVINSAITWVEIQKHGLSVMKSWNPTIDNWYFAIYPIHYVVFWLFGGPSILILNIISAVQVTLCSLFASLIAYKVTQRKSSFLLIILFSSLSSFSYAVGFISHPFSHNVINIYGLLCILIYISFSNKIATCLSISFLSIIASISDPWFIVAYLLPFLLHSLYNKKINNEESWFQPLVYILTLALFFSKVIQKALNLPVANFKLAVFDVIYTNVKWFFLDLGRMINLFFIESAPAYFISSLVLIFLLIFMIWKKKNSLNVLLLLSILGVTSSFVIGLPEKMEYSARFLVNIIYIIPLMIFINTQKKLIPIVSLFFVIMLTSAIYSHTLHTKDNHDLDAKEQMAFMKENHLTYGYGAYWGAKANAISWLSNGGIIIRPMMIENNTGRIDWESKHAQSFDSWYKPRPEKTFIAISPDVETCPNTDLCINGMKEQFGAPDNTLKFRNITFLVYNEGLK
jgi:hypothetical protein